MSLQAKVGDLVPGSFKGDEDKSLEESSGYYPQFSWSVLESTFSIIEHEPDKPSTEWPLYQVWQEFATRRFGYIPTEQHTVEEGKLWSWSEWDSGYRRIHSSFTRNGYKPGLITGGEAYTVYIERHGELCVIQGNKKIALLRMKKGLDFPLKLIVGGRHPNWIQLRQVLLDLAGGAKTLYQPIDHPEFRDWGISQPCVERLSMIRKYLPTNFVGSVLDLGCHTGWFVREFARQGCYTVGVDHDKSILQIAKAVDLFRHNDDLHGSYALSDVLEYLVRDTLQYDICLCFSLIMHLFTKSSEKAWRALDLISRKCPVMFLDCVWGNYSDALPFTEKDIEREMLDHTQYTKSKLLGRTWHENRPLFVFDRRDN